MITKNSVLHLFCKHFQASLLFSDSSDKLLSTVFLTRVAFQLVLLFAFSFPMLAQSDSTKAYSIGRASSDGTGKYYMGREIAHVMGAAGSDWLDRNSRQKEENSSLAVSRMPITSKMRVADIGAGTGYYSFMIAAKVPEGKVYAVEIQEELIDTLHQRIKSKGIRNMEVVKGSTKTCNLPENSIDMALMVDVYHELAFPVEVLKDIRRSLASDGKLVLLEYKGEDPAVAIKEHHKMTVAQVKKEMEANGFKLISNGDFLPIQHLLVFGKSDK